MTPPFLCNYTNKIPHACSSEQDRMAAFHLLSFLNLVLINIRGAVGNEPHLQSAVDELHTQPDIILLTETKMGHGDTVNIPNYTCWSQPDPHNTSTGGTAILIHDRLLSVCTPTTPPHSAQYPDTGHTQWIRILNKNKPIFLSLSYISPNDQANYVRTTNALTQANQDLNKAGTCINTGDFNNHLPALNTIFKQMTKTLGVESMHNPALNRYDMQYTFNGLMGKSCPDHFLLPVDLRSSQNTYWVYQDLNCGSDHRLMQADIIFNPIDDTTWGTHANRTCDWSNKNTIIKYENALSKSSDFIIKENYKNLPRDKATISILANQLTTDISKAHIEVSKKSYAPSTILSKKKRKHHTSIMEWSRSKKCSSTT